MAQCLAPGSVFMKREGRHMPVPCGKCPACHARRISGWVFRLQQEMKVSDSCHFLTLTYDDQHLPGSPNGLMSLRKIDWQKFMKRLRKLTPAKIKYYAVGEYGGMFSRPHYHAIIFNISSEMAREAWTLEGSSIGLVHCPPVLGDGALRYVLNYTMKDRFKGDPLGLDDREAEFMICSLGLGASYLTQAMKRWHHADLENRYYVPLQDGGKASMPHYYRKKLYGRVHRQIIAFHAQRRRTKCPFAGYVENWNEHQAKAAAFRNMERNKKERQENRMRCIPIFKSKKVVYEKKPVYRSVSRNLRPQRLPRRKKQFA